MYVFASFTMRRLKKLKPSGREQKPRVAEQFLWFFGKNEPFQEKKKSSRYTHFYNNNFKTKIEKGTPFKRNITKTVEQT